MRRLLPALLLLLLLCASLRLGGEVRVRGANFTYDGAGNRIKELLNTATVPGNATAANITAAQFASLYANEIDYGYDDLNRLANVTLNGNYTTPGVGTEELTEILYYHYDYQNRRALRLDDQTAWPTAEAQQVWQEVYDGPGPVRDEYASYAGGWTLGLQADYVRGSDWGGGIGGVLYAIPNGGNGTNTAKYYNYDGRGDVVALTSNTGNITYAAAYNAYGQHATVTAGNVTTTGTQEVGTDTDLFRLTTKEEDPFGGVYDTNRELGLNDNNWFQRDPAGMVNGPNPYTYVEQNNWTKFDPDGRQTMDPVSPGNLLPALTVIALTGIVVDIGYHDVKNYLHPSSPAPSSDQSPAPAAAAPTKQPAAAQPSAAPPPPNGEGDDGDKSLNKNKSGGNNPEGSAKGDADKAADKAADTKAARQKGIRDMWKQEAENIKNGKPSRDWTPQQQKDILEGRVPKSVVDGKPIEGAHIEPVKDAPEKAADPNNIKPKSFTEHRAADGGEHSSNPKPYDTGPTTTP